MVPIMNDVLLGGAANDCLNSRYIKQYACSVLGFLESGRKK
jgi:hypothetical protein